MGFFSNLLGGAEHLLGIHTNPQPQRPQRPQPPQQPQHPDLAHFLAAHLGNAVRNPIGEVTHDVGSIVQQGGKMLPQVYHQIGQLQGVQQMRRNVPGLNAAGHLISTQVINPISQTDQRVGALMQGHNAYAPGLKGVGQGITDAANIASVVPGLGLGIKTAKEAPLLIKTAAHFANGAPLGIATSVGADLQNGNHNLGQIAKNAAVSGAFTGGLNAAPGVTGHFLGKAMDSVNALDQKGHLNLNGEVNPKDPLASLKQEALKYKSADEFRKAMIYNDNVAFHQTGKTTADKIAKEGFIPGSKTGLGEKRNEVYAMRAYDWMKHGKVSKDTYARDGSGVSEVPINLKGLNLEDRTGMKFTDEQYVKGEHKAIPKGKDGVVVGYGNGINEVLLTPEAANKARFNLTDLYNQAHSGKAMSVGPTDPLAQLKQEALKYKSADEFVKAQGKTFYRGDGNGSMPKNMTAQDILNYERNDLGNADVVPAEGVDLSKVKSDNLQWVTGTKAAAKEYGSVSPVQVGGHRVIATDGQGGFLIEKTHSPQQLTDLYHQAHSEASTQVPVGTKFKFNAKGEPVKVGEQPRNVVGQYGNKTQTVKPGSLEEHFNNIAPIINDANPQEVKDGFWTTMHQLQHAHDLYDTPGKIKASDRPGLRNVINDLSHAALRLRAEGINRHGLDPAEFGLQSAPQTPPHPFKQFVDKVVDTAKKINPDQKGAIGLGENIGGGKPPVEPPLKASTAMEPGEQMRGFTQSVKAADEVSQPTKDLTMTSYTPKANKELVANSESLVKGGLKKATDQVHTTLDVPHGQLTDQHVSDAIAVAKAHDAKGNFRDAADIYDKLAEHLTEAGRQVQAASLLSRRTPQGLLYSAQKELKKAGVELTPQIEKELQGALSAVKGAAEGSPERAYAVQTFLKTVANHIPSSHSDKLIGIWKAGLLTGIRTQTGNALSNIANQGLKKASDPIAAGIDRAFSVFTGTRTKTATLKGLGSGTKEGIAAAGKYMKTGVDERNLSNLKYDAKQLNYNNPIINSYVNGVFKLMGAADRPYYYAALKNSLADIGKAEGLNQGLKGQDLKSFVEGFMKNPPDQAQEMAVKAAEKSVFANDTLLSNLASGARQKLSDHPVGNAAINIIMPFTKVPSSVVTQVFDYTPVGAIKELVQQGYKRQLDQRAMSEALGKATVGTVGVISAGYGLANAGVLTGAYPKDPKEQAAWKAERKQPNSILIGGKWRSLNYVSPFGPLLGMGQNIAQAVHDGGNALDGVTAAVGGGVQTALGQSFLQGVQGVLDAVNDPGRYGAKTARNMLASVVPTIVGDAAKATDSVQRQTNTIKDAVTNKIPGLREGNLPSSDAFGNTLQRPTGTVGTMTDPLRSSTNNTNPLFQELDRLQGVKQGVYPTPDKTIQVGTQQIKLDPKQATDYNNAVGQQTQAIWNQIVATPDYKALPDDQKKQALQKALDDVRATEKIKALQAMGDMTNADKLVQKLTVQQLAVGQGNAKPTDYTTKSTGANLDPKTRYQKAQTAYTANKKAGKLNSSQDLKAQTQLAKLKIQSGYSQDVLDFYGLSNDQKNQLFKQDPTTAKSLYDQAKQLDAQLVQAGLGSTKFKNGISVKSKGTGVKTARVARIRTAKVKLPKFKSVKISAPKTAHIKTVKPRYAKLSGRSSASKVKQITA